MSSQAVSTSPWGLSTLSPHTLAKGLTSGCMPAMCSWKTRALAMMAQAMRRVWDTSIIPSRRAIAKVMLDRSFAHFVQELCGAFDALFQCAGGLVYGALRNGHQADHVGQVLNGPLQPARLRETVHVLGALGEDAVAEAGRRQRSAQVMGFAKGVRVAEGDGGFDNAPVGGHLQPEAGPGLRFDGTCGHVLGLDHYGRAAGRGDDDVRAQPEVAGYRLRVLGAHLATRQHVLQQTA